jgi:pimeloyl-ACP methyl ester carboxylesterase
VRRVSGEFPHVEGVEHRFVRVNGVRIHLAEAGAASAAALPVLLLHGWPQHWYMWHEVIAGLRGDHRLIAPDLRGFGWSEAPGHGYDGESFAADQIALLDALEIERAFVIGHDWGGWTAFLLGLLHPERIERMVVLNAPHPWPRVTPRLLAEAWRSWYSWVLATPGVGPWAMRRGWLAHNILGHGNVATPFDAGEVELYVNSFREPARADAASQLYRYYQRTFREIVGGRWQSHRLTVPTRIVFGERDRYVSPKLLPGYEPYADDLQVELIPGSGHFIANENPDLVVERARQFLG